MLTHAGPQADVAARELLRVTRPGGLVIISVLPRGNHDLPYILEVVRSCGIQAVDEAIVRDEGLPDGSAIPWRAFTQHELESMAVDLDCEVVSISASNVLATVEQIPLLEQMERDTALWHAFLRWEEHSGIQRANTERGAFILAVLRKNGTILR